MVHRVSSSKLQVWLIGKGFYVFVHVKGFYDFMSEFSRYSASHKPSWKQQKKNHDAARLIAEQL